MAKFWVVLFLPWVSWELAAADNQAIFREKIAPILQSHCASCHSETNPQNNLSVASFEDLLQGGKTGPAVVPGSARKSLLMQKSEFSPL